MNPTKEVTKDMKVQETQSREQSKKKLVRSGVLMLVDLVIIGVFVWIAISRGWFVSLGSGSESRLDVNVGKVSYDLKYYDDDIAGNGIFIPRFYVEELNDRFDNLDNEGEDIPATSISNIVRYDVTSIVVTNTEVTVEQEASIRFRANLLPEDTTENVTWSSSDPSIVTVTKYGRVRGVQITTEPVTITATIANHQTKTFRVSVIQASEEAEASYVPANANIIKDAQSFSVINHSSVPTKLRAVVDVEYSGIGEDDTKQTYSIEQIKQQLALGGITENVDWTLSQNGPVDLQVATQAATPLWQKLPLKKGFSVTDTSGYIWNITKIYLAPTAFSAISSISGVENLSYISGMQTAYYYGTANPGISDYTLGDYGTVVPPASSPEGDEIDVFSSIMLTDAYTTFSTLKGICVKIIIQARQADYFVPNSSGDHDDDGWFDVCTCSYAPYE